jgi:hypothetical protein
MADRTSRPSAIGSDTEDSGPRGSLKLFYSYAHEDELILAELRKHLAPLRHEQIIVDWHDRELLPGADWDPEISGRLESADIVLAFISSDFVASAYAYGRELHRALELHDQGRLALVPVIARPCYWQPLPISRLQMLPDGAKPIMSWTDPSDRDESFVSVVRGVERVARDLLSRSDSLADDWLESRLIRRRVIREVQRHLRDLGHYEGPLDGIPGSKTEDALVAFQRQAGISVDAMIGPEVIRHLEAAVAALSGPEG